MSSLTSRIAVVIAVFMAFTCTGQAAASNPESLRLKRDLRACIDKSLALANSQNTGDVSAVLSACDAELRVFTASISDETRRQAIRIAINGYVQENLDPVRTAEDSSG